MTATNENFQLPEGVDPAQLYDGPKVVHLPSGKASFMAPEGSHVEPVPHPPPQALVRPIPQAPPAAPVASPGPVSHQAPSEEMKIYPQVLMLALEVLSARLLGLIALVTACLIWAGVVYDPNLWRVVAAGAFSTSVFWPMAAIYWKAGITGEGS